MLQQITANPYFIPALAGVSILSLVLAIIALALAGAMRSRYKKIMVDGAGKDITDAIINYYKKCTDMMNEFKTADIRIEELEKNIRLCGQKIGCYRYDAFDDNKGKLSFAVAVLDAENTGFVLNGVFARQQSSTYLKPITRGSSQRELTEEENEAIRLAMLNYEKQMGHISYDEQ